MVGATAVIQQLGIPRSTLYHLVKLGKIPTYDVRKPWHTQQRIKFKMSEVEAALEQLGKEAE